MIITFLRSSSYNTYSICPCMYTFEYVLGIKPPSGRAATVGSIVHKGLELLGRQKLAQQNGESSFSDDELDGTWKTGEIEPGPAIDLAWAHYTARESHIAWKPADLRECHRLINLHLELDDGYWDPRNHKIVMPELYFNFEIEEPWAKYKYEVADGTIMEGQLGLKGTVDLICDISDEVTNTYLYMDFKTGARRDHSLDGDKAVKNWSKLYHDDFQLRLYHLALSKLFPDKNWIISIVYMKDGGAFSLPFGPDDIPKTMKMIRDRFEVIKNTVKPKARISYRCSRWCHFGKTNYVDQDGNDTGKTICQHFRNEIDKKGLDRVVGEYADVGAIGKYGSGGGKEDRE